VREFMAARGAELPIIVKLEKPEAVARLRDILELATRSWWRAADLGGRCRSSACPPSRSSRSCSRAAWASP